MSDSIILFDLPSIHKGDGTYSCFSFNPWKARLVLNYKKLPYKTEWCDYPDLGPRLKELGVAPNLKEDAFAEYTSPTIRLPDGKFVVDSIDIAEELESRYPEPTIRLDQQLHGPVTEAVTNAAWGIMADAMVSVVRDVLTEKSAPWFAEDRKKRFGMSLEELAAQMGGEPAWKAAEQTGGSLEKLKDVLTQHRKDEGPFVLGSEVSYGDFIAAGLFECMQRCDKKMYERLIGYDESFSKLHEACGPWLQKDD